MPGNKKDILEYLKRQAEMSCPGFVAEPESGDPWALMREEVSLCRRCRLGAERINACFGNGSLTAKIMFVGEGPGYEEDHRGQVFIGRAGKLLERMLLEVCSLSREDVFITNIVKCHPMKDPSDPDRRSNDRPPKDDELEACRPFLKRQIELMKPEIIVSLGSPASKHLLSETAGISRLRGKVYDTVYMGLPVRVLPTYHPAYILRNGSSSPDMESDLALLKKWL